MLYFAAYHRILCCIVGGNNLDELTGYVWYGLTRQRLYVLVVISSTPYLFLSPLYFPI